MIRMHRFSSNITTVKLNFFDQKVEVLLHWNTLVTVVSNYLQFSLQLLETLWITHFITTVGKN